MMLIVYVEGRGARQKRQQPRTAATIPVKAARNRTSGQTSLHPLLLIAPSSSSINSHSSLQSELRFELHDLSRCLSLERSSRRLSPSPWLPSSLPVLSSFTESTLLPTP